MNSTDRSPCTVEAVHDVLFSILCDIDEVCRRCGIAYTLIDGTLLGAVRHGDFIPWDDDADIAMTRENFEKFRAVAQRELPDHLFVQTRETDPWYDMINIPMKIRDDRSTMIEEKNKRYHQGMYVDVFILDNLGADADAGRALRKKSQLLLTAKRKLSRRDFPSPAWALRSLLQLGGKLIPAEWALRRVERWRQQALRNGRGPLYSYHFGCGWNTEWRETELFPLREIPLRGHLFFAPQDPHAVLTATYGADYQQLPPEEQRVTHALYTSLQREFDFPPLPMYKKDG